MLFVGIFLVTYIMLVTIDIYTLNLPTNMLTTIDLIVFKLFPAHWLYTPVQIGVVKNWTTLKLLWHMLGLAALTIWARAVGPRMRPDLITSIFWTDVLIITTATLLLAFVSLT